MQGNDPRMQEGYQTICDALIELKQSPGLQQYLEKDGKGGYDNKNNFYFLSNGVSYCFDLSSKKIYSVPGTSFGPDDGSEVDLGDFISLSEDLVAVLLKYREEFLLYIMVYTLFLRPDKDKIIKGYGYFTEDGVLFWRIHDTLYARIDMNNPKTYFVVPPQFQVQGTPLDVNEEFLLYTTILSKTRDRRIGSTVPSRTIFFGPFSLS